MKLFKSTILAMLGMAVALTSCSDDEDYIPANPKAGVYFPNTVSTEIQILPTESSFDIPVGRVKDGPASATVTATAPAGFTVPSTVTFDGQATTANLTITYDPSKLTIGETYKISLSVAEAANVGVSSADFLLTFAPELITEKFEVGTGVYYYKTPWLDGASGANPINYTYDPTAPNKRTIVIGDWGVEGLPFTITCADFTPNEEGVIILGTPEMDSGIMNGGTQPVLCMDVQSYGAAFGFNLSPEKYPYSYYDPETGTFYMNMIYYAGDKPADGSAFFIGTEIFQMDGYPDYAIDVTYNGMLTDRDGMASATFTITPGADVATVKAVLVPGEDPNVGVAQILQGGEGVLEFPYAEEIPVSIPVAEGGYYSFVAVSFDGKGEPQEADADVFRLYLGANPDADWEDVGMADYADGWIIPVFKDENGVFYDPLDFVYSVPLQRHKEQTNVYRLVEPYGSSHPAAGANPTPKKRNIVFSFAAQDIILFEPQGSGYDLMEDGTELVICNMEGLWASQGATVEEIRASMKPENLSTFEEGVVTVPMPLNVQGDKVYSWKNQKPTNVFMPDASEEVRAKATAASIARPTINGMRRNLGSERRFSAFKRNINDHKYIPLRRVK